MSAINLFSAVLSGASLLAPASDLGTLPLGMVHSAAMHSAIAPSDLATFGAMGDFSRTYCLAICAMLVPANLLATLQTLIFVGCNRPRSTIRWITSAASLYAVLMLLHILTWFVVGVVMLPTFVLTGLGGLCLGLNVWAIARPQSLSKFLRRLVGWGYALLPKRFPTVPSLPVLPEQG
ncbi:hypothetical protein [Thermoleptolyngbya sp. PKUAC-SCTB121]|uniref:hypothetical protein n=1 Tax=Thermoleptolyngbya sp. PKUAC-SCTB121 TaxID=2811482 RepID=UPI0019663168|nr:hypothetical protein [Thermoleptolyngbya sp. PKUAC-SCTB121]